MWEKRYYFKFGCGRIVIRKLKRSFNQAEKHGAASLVKVKDKPRQGGVCRGECVGGSVGPERNKVFVGPKPGKEWAMMVGSMQCQHQKPCKTS